MSPPTTTPQRRVSTRELLQQLPRTLRLVWEGDRSSALVLGALTLAQAMLPAAVAWDPRVESRHPQLVARGLYEDCEHPAAGVHPVPGLPYRWTGIDRWIRTPTPTLGQHNREILGGLLGLDDAELDDLEESGIIGSRPAGVDDL